MRLKQTIFLGYIICSHSVLTVGLHVMLFPWQTLCTFTLILFRSMCAVPSMLFSRVPWRHPFQICCSSILSIISRWFRFLFCYRYHVFQRVLRIAINDYWLRHVCPSVRPCGTTRLLLDGFYLYLTFEYFSRTCCEISSFLKFRQE